MIKPTPSGRERRQHARVVLRSTAYLLLSGHSPIEVRTFDIGIGGIGIVAPANPPANLSCTIRVTIPVKPQGSTSFEVQAKVVNSVLSGSEDGFRVGLQFINLSSTAESAILRLLQP